MPNCPLNCRAAHTVQMAMFLLGVKKTKLYELMSKGELPYVDRGYGRRIFHDVIDKYLREGGH